MLEKILAFILILAVYLVYTCWIKPRRTMKSYVKQLKGLGYNVL
jgi:hypothetical protein